MTAAELVHQARANRVELPPAPDVLQALRIILDLLLAGDEYRRNPAGNVAVAARAIASMIAVVEDTTPAELH